MYIWFDEAPRGGCRGERTPFVGMSRNFDVFSASPGSSSLLRLHLTLDPEVRLAEPLGDGDGGGPRESFLDEGVVAVAATNPLRAGDVSDREVLSLEAHRDRRKLVHAHLRKTVMARGRAHSWPRAAVMIGSARALALKNAVVIGVDVDVIRQIPESGM